MQDRAGLFPLAVNLADGRVLVPIHLADEQSWPSLKDAHDPWVARIAAQNGFAGKPDDLLIVPDDLGRPARVFAGARAAADFRALAGRLPEGDYRLDAGTGPLDWATAARGWALGAYKYAGHHQRAVKGAPRLLAPDLEAAARAGIIAEAGALARDLVNAPANLMGPVDLEARARELAVRFDAEILVVSGEDLLRQGYPAVHAVGRAAAVDREPRMLEMRWGDPGHPVLAVVGKGVTFDTGGLDLKPSSAMRLMKKDMGGAAHALALGLMVMALRLPVRLTVLIPAVENAVAGAAMRPGDVLETRKGLTVEVGNTDAEGRLILADALTRACELQPALTLDYATLTGAARIALGPQVIPFYTLDDSLAADLSRASESSEDPLWRMPLWSGYAGALDSDVADLKNDPDAWAQAGSVTAALFLQRFAPAGAWAHFDIFAWNPKARPGHPPGAEVQAILASLAVIEARFGG